MLITVVAGQPVIETSNFALVPVNVTVALPLQVASASVIGGFSFEALSSALNVFAGVGDGDGDGDGDGVGDAVRVGDGLGLGAAAVPPHAAMTTAAAAMPANRRICQILLAGSSDLYGPAGRSDEQGRPSRPSKPDSGEDGHPSRAEVALRPQ